MMDKTTKVLLIYAAVMLAFILLVILTRPK